MLRFVLGAFLFFFGVLLFVLGSSLIFTSKFAKPREARRMVSDLLLGGDERFLDVECSRGQLAVAAAKRINTGFVVGLDTWDPRRVTGNDPHSPLANCAAEGVPLRRVACVKGSPFSIPFADESFDVVATCLGFSHAGKSELEEALTQMARVVRPGGRLAVLLTGYGRIPPGLVQRLGLSEARTSNFRLGVFPGAQRLIARKPVTAKSTRAQRR